MLKLTARDSPITAESISLSGLSFSDAQTSSDGRLFVRCEDRTKQGKGSILSISAIAPEEQPIYHTPEDHNVRSAVHEYGGGSFAVFSTGLIYTDCPSFKVYRKSLQSNVDEQPQLIFPVQEEHSACRMADFCVVRRDDGEYVLAVMEDHKDPAPSKVVNALVVLKTDGSGIVQTIASGLDFYAAPSFDPTSNRLAYVGWNHPNMPWDDTTLYVVTLGNDFSVQDEPIAVHGAGVSGTTNTEGGTTSVYSPQWTKTGDLLFLSDITGWYNIRKWTPATAETTALCPKEADFAESKSGWTLGVKSYCIMEDGTIAARYTDPSVGTLVVLLQPDETISEYGRDVLPPTSIGSLCATGKSLYFLGGGIKEPVAIWCWKHAGGGDAAPTPATRILSSLKVDSLGEIGDFMSLPRAIEAHSSGGGVGTGHCFAYYYPPNNLSPELPSNFAPPMLVKAHGGPTAATSTTFRIDIQFWTSRGFAVLDVDYGGSTGYGKEYRQSLNGNWGILDIQDVVTASQYCIDRGEARSEWVCIDGKSAGGYTAVAALVFGNHFFQAGASLYGIGDLSKLVEETHKFESRYLDRLIGPYPKAKAIYDARCPILHTNRLKAPMILLQGDEDKVVPPNQAVDMFEVCQQKGVPSALVMYKGEQHGFRKAENMKHSLLSEYFFFCTLFGLDPQKETGFDGVRMNERVDI